MTARSHRIVGVRAEVATQVLRVHWRGGAVTSKAMAEAIAYYASGAHPVPRVVSLACMAITSARERAA